MGHDEQKSSSGDHNPKSGMSTVGKLVLVVSIVLMIAGASLKVMAMTQDRPEESATAGTGESVVDPDLLASGFAATGDPRESTANDSTASTENEYAIDVWSPALFKLGFSFFVGFCIGYAVRTFVKVSIIGIGMILLILFGLQYAGLIDVDWNAFQDRYDGIMGWLRAETETFSQFVKGSLPSAGAVAAGLVFGFRSK
ncbi:MAG: FUN14 domain-containing protein [Planctomycetota bacterium]